MGQSWLSTVWTGGGPWMAGCVAVFLIYYDFKLWFSEECSVPGSTGPRGGNGVGIRPWADVDTMGDFQAGKWKVGLMRQYCDSELVSEIGI